MLKRQRRTARLLMRPKSTLALRRGRNAFSRVKPFFTHIGHGMITALTWLGRLFAAPFIALFLALSSRRRIRVEDGSCDPLEQTLTSRLHIALIPGRHPWIRAVDILLLILIVGSGVFFGWALVWSDTSIAVSVNDNGLTTDYLTKQPTVEAFLSDNAIVLHAADILSTSMETPLTEETQLSIQRAFPVAVASQGNVNILQMAGGTVGHALSLAGISYDAEDELTYSVFEDVTPGMYIQHIDIVTEYETQLRTIPYEEEVIKDSSLYENVTRIKTEGSNGEKEVTYRNIYKDGELATREIVDQRVLKEAVDEVTIVGTKIRYQTNFQNDTRRWKEAPTESQIKEVLVMKVTAYTHTGRRTATGTRPKLGTIAVNPDIIPYGTRLYVPGYGYGKAEDTGAFRKYNGGENMQIDIFLDTTKECRRWGSKRNVKVYILK